MSKSNTLYYAIAAIVIVVIIVLIIKSTKSEGFAGLGHTFRPRVDRVARDSDGGFMSVPGYRQEMLPPRFGNVDYGAAIRYNPAPKGMMGVPSNPMSYSDMADVSVEGFTAPECGASGANAGSVYGMSGIRNMPKSDFKAGEVSGTIKPSGEKVNLGGLLPVTSMSEVTASGGMAHVAIYDRLMVSNGKSRLRGRGDPIRGDLPIVPMSGNWFTVAAQPDVDLMDGAMNVMGGNTNATARNTHQLQSESVAGVVQTYGGVDYAPQSTEGMGADGSVQVTMFP